MSDQPLLSQLLQLLSPGIRSSLGELQGTLHLIAHDLDALAPADASTERRSELVMNAQRRVDEFAIMLGIVSHLDSLARGDLKPQPEYVDLVRLLEQLAHRLNAQHVGEPVKLRLNRIPADCTNFRHALVDAQNLSQLLTYILRFAWETTQQAQVSMDVTMKAGGLHCVIANHGAYVSAAELDRLGNLEPWSSEASMPMVLDDPTLRLGLNLSNAIAHGMRGSCVLVSDAERGLVWTLDLPAPVPDLLAQMSPSDADIEFSEKHQGPGSPGQDAAETSLPWSAKTLLVVDDSQASRLVTRALLESLGHNVIEAANGVEALVRLRTDPAGPFDAVIMDLEMPQMDGLSAARAIRELPSIPASLPLIALTGHSAEQELEACLEAGFNDFLGKPMHKQSLDDCLCRTLGVSGTEALAPEVNEVVLEELRSFVGDIPLERLLKQFLLELDERLLVVGSAQANRSDDVRHNLQMMRYSAERFGFERLAQCAKQLSEVEISLNDIAIGNVRDQSPGLVLKPSDQFLSGLHRLQSQAANTQTYLQAYLDNNDTSLDAIADE
ncbi:MAG: response regulator [Pseudomonadales bacterium]|nr:response regulator [Pseudomonadales bacterium]